MALPSLSVANQSQPKQKTKPKKGDPVEIPVPKRKDFFGALRRVARDVAVRRTSTKK
jgi:hypothetical protein